MARINLETPRFYLEIDPELGAGVAEFSTRREGKDRLPIMRTAPRDAGWFNHLSCYLLAPWSNRIKGARFLWRGDTYALPADWPDGTAIHGLVKDKPFRIVERSPVSALLRYDHQPGNADGWPWSFRCDARYQLTDRGMLVRLRLKNTTSVIAVPMPAGVGFHPFFPREGPASVDPASLRYDSR